MIDTDFPNHKTPQTSYLKRYVCPCGTEWHDEHDCLCDDRSPDSDTACELTDYEEVAA